MKASTWTMDLLRLVFQNVNADGVGDSDGLRGSSMAGNLFVSLHVGDPGFDGTQNSSEATYPGYKRIAVPRSKTRWTVEQNADGLSCQVSNATLVSFPEAIGGNQRVTHIGIGASAAGASKLLYSGALNKPRQVESGIILAFDVGQIVLTEK